MATKIKTDGSIVIQTLGSDPSSPEDGQIWYNSVAEKFRFYENGTVKELGSGGGSSYACLLYNASPVSIPNNVETDLDWSNEDYDDGMHAGTDPSAVVIPVSGNYRLSTFAVFAANAVGKRELKIYRDATAVAPDRDLNPAAAETSILRAEITMALTAGDEIRVKVLQDSGGSLNVTGSNHVGGAFSVVKI